MKKAVKVPKREAEHAGEGTESFLQRTGWGHRL